MTAEIHAAAANYTSAWNSGSAEAVASFYAETGGIVINRGTPWTGRAGVQAMRVQDGKVVEGRDYYDSASIARQLGLVA